ncbi:hypothetical protein [Dyella ginsengisoli]|uniref:hypothetical protein n=1 Tax=Dyella ginsengisoli TaxID=363848 RepID=UPI0012FE2BDB|nr:hypothetical protein [Dyella ginsengisoli]
MRRVAPLLALGFVLVFRLVPAADSAEQVAGYIYDGTGRSKSTSIVINVTTHDVAIQGKPDARINNPADVITNNYKDCSNKDFYCLTGMLEIVIPKAMPMKQWKYHDVSCQTVAQSRGDAYLITCRSPKYRGRPTYTYSLTRGVLSIESAPVAGDYRYELRGKYGLFSPGVQP